MKQDPYRYETLLKRFPCYVYYQLVRCNTQTT